MKTPARSQIRSGLLALSLLGMVNGAAAQIPTQTPPGNGKIAFTTNREGLDNYEIYVMDATGSNQTNLTNNPGDDYEPAWSPLGLQIAFTSGRDGNYEIYVMGANGSNQTRLTTNSADEGYPAWSPDGARITFQSSRDGNYEIYAMDANGSNPTRLTNNPAFDVLPSWSPDGTKIAFSSNRDGNYEIYSMDANGSNPTRLTNEPTDDYDPTWSPDGTRIAFLSNRDGNAEIYAMDANGSNPTNLTNNPGHDFEPMWSPDGSKIAFSSRRDNNLEVYIMAANGSNQTRLTNNKFDNDGGPDWQRIAGPTPTPGPPNPNNILVSVGNGGATDPVLEFTPEGVLVQTFLFNYNNGSYASAEYLRDIVVHQDGTIAGYNGTFAPYLTRFDPASMTSTHTTFSGWNTTNTTTHGKIASYQNFIYVTDENAGSGMGPLKGIVRFNTSNNTAARFAEDTEFIDLEMGLDGSLYAVPNSNNKVNVYNPVTMALVRQIPLPAAVTSGSGPAGIAVDQMGRLFICGDQQTVFRLSNTGALEASKSTGFFGLSDIDIDETGRIIIAQRDRLVLVGNSNLTSDFTFFQADTNLGFPAMFVSFARPLQIASPPAKALNIATRMRVQTGNNVLIGGFIVTGSALKSVAVRGIGPSLIPFGINDALADPTLELRSDTGALIAGNDDWQDDSASASQLTALGLALQDPKESGLVATLQPGAYTAILAGKNGGTGVGLVEIYDTNPAVNSQLANISTRGFVLTGNNVMIGGFILGGNTNTGIIVRGIGPSLAQFGLSPVLANPTLELHDGNGALLISNDNWQDDPASASQLIARGLALQDSNESGIFASLPPGAFTAILAGANDGTGIGLVEIYNVH